MLQKNFKLFLLIISCSAIIHATDTCEDYSCDIENNVPRSPYDNYIKNAIKDAMICIDSKVLDMRKPLDMSSDILKLNLMLRDLKVTGLNSVNLDHVKFNIGKFALVLKIEFPNIILEALYSLNSIIDDDLLRVYGEGYFHTSLSNVMIDVEMKLNYTNQKFKLNHMTIGELQPKKEDMNFKISGFMNDDEMSEIMGRRLPEVIEETVRDFNDDIKEFLITTLTPIASSQLDGKTLNDIKNLKFNCEDLLKILSNYFYVQN